MQTISSIFCSLFKCSNCRDPPITPTDSTTQSPNLELQFEDQAKFRLNIIGITGKTIQQNVFQLMKLKDVKNYAVEKMFDGSNRSDHFKLIRCKTCEIFDEDNDDDTIKKIGIDDEEEFLLVKKRKLNIFTKEESPTKEELLERTKHLPTLNPSPPFVKITEFLNQDDIRHDLRKVVLEISQKSAYILAAGPYAQKLIEFYRQKIRRMLKKNTQSVQVLCKMGFSKESVFEALKLKANNATMALDWLIENRIERSLTPCSPNEGCEETSPEAIWSDISYYSEESTSSRQRSSCISSKKVQSIFHSNFVWVTSYKENVKNLLEIIQFYGEKQELAKKAGITFLTDMGFEKNASEMALLAGRNNINAAIEWICENHFDKAAEIQKPQESLILKKILESPTLQKSLGDPILFHAYLALLENKSDVNTKTWLNNYDCKDPLEILMSTHYNEKQISFINQLNRK